jgi:hypothetical protein
MPDEAEPSGLAPQTSMRGRISFVSEQDSDLVEAAASVEIDFAYDATAQALEMRVNASSTGGHQALDETRVFLGSGLAFRRETQSSFINPDQEMRGVEAWEALPLTELAGPDGRELCLTGISGPDPRLLSGNAVPARIRPTGPEQIPMVPSLALLSQSIFRVVYWVSAEPIVLRVARIDDRLELATDWIQDETGSMHFRAAWWPVPSLSIIPPDPAEIADALPVILGAIASPLGHQCNLFATTDEGEQVSIDLAAGVTADGLLVDDRVSLDLAGTGTALHSAALGLSGMDVWDDLEVVTVRSAGRSWPGNRTGSEVTSTVAAVITEIHDDDPVRTFAVLLDPPLPPHPGSSEPRFLHLDAELALAAQARVGELVAIHRSLRMGEDPLGWIEWVERVRDGAILQAGRPWEFPLGSKPILHLEDE